MKKTKFLIGLLLTFFVIYSCEKEKSIEPQDFSVSYVKVSSWVDSYYNAAIDQDGVMQVTATNGLNNTNRTSEYQLIDSDIKIISEKLDNVINLDISDNYGLDYENAPSDFPITKLSYQTIQKSDSTAIYYPKENELPAVLDSFLQTIEQIILANDTLVN